MGSQLSYLLGSWALVSGATQFSMSEVTTTVTSTAAVGKFCTGHQNWQLLCHSWAHLSCAVSLGVCCLYSVKPAADRGLRFLLAYHWGGACCGYTAHVEIIPVS